MVLDAWAQASNISFSSDRYGDVAQIRFKGRTFHLLKPSTYMNLSGKAVSYWLKKLNLTPESLLVVVDDLALPLGTLRLRGKGSDGGHNGLANIAEMIGTTEYPRLRVGIGPKVGDQIDYVLGKWTPDELETIRASIPRAIDAVKSFALAGLSQTMTQYNR